MTLKEVGRRRQHRSDHECHDDRKKESLGDIEDAGDADRRQNHQGDGDDLGALDDGRELVTALGQG